VNGFNLKKKKRKDGGSREERYVPGQERDHKPASRTVRRVSVFSGDDLDVLSRAEVLRGGSMFWIVWWALRVL